MNELMMQVSAQQIYTNSHQVPPVGTWSGGMFFVISKLAVNVLNVSR